MKGSFALLALAGACAMVPARAEPPIVIKFSHVVAADTPKGRAAEFFNVCRARGVTGGPIDMLISSVAYRHAIPVFAADTDFVTYARHLPLQLHRPR